MFSVTRIRDRGFEPSLDVRTQFLDVNVVVLELVLDSLARYIPHDARLSKLYFHVVVRPAAAVERQFLFPQRRPWRWTLRDRIVVDYLSIPIDDTLLAQPPIVLAMQSYDVTIPYTFDRRSEFR